jgi:hypothetical protein
MAIPASFNSNSKKRSLWSFEQEQQANATSDPADLERCFGQIRAINVLCRTLNPREEPDNGYVCVIGSHMSLKISLPVFEIILPEGAGKILLRDNFYDTKISFELNTSLPKDTFGRIGYFDAMRAVPLNGCEGFPENRIYGAFWQDQKHFTVETDVLKSLSPQRLIFLVNHLIQSLAPKPTPPTQRSPV